MKADFHTNTVSGAAAYERERAKDDIDDGDDPEPNDREHRCPGCGVRGGHAVDCTEGL